MYKGRDVALACLVVKGGEAAGGRGPGRRQAAGAAAKDRAVQPLLRVAKGDQVPHTLALVFGRSGPERRVRILYVGTTDGTHGTRVTHRRDARLEAGRRAGFSSTAQVLKGLYKYFTCYMEGYRRHTGQVCFQL